MQSTFFLQVCTRIFQESAQPMIIRIVRMEFQPDRVPEFEAIFAASKHAIRRFSGCLRLEMNVDADLPHVRYTYSWWESQQALDNYRDSELFQTTWAATKALFGGKPMAFSLNRLETVPYLPESADLSRTLSQYDAVVGRCRELFLRKNADYGASWAMLRMPSITDQLLIKAERIRSIQQSGVNKVGDSIESEFVGIINYCIIALILLDQPDTPPGQQPVEWSHPGSLASLYDRKYALMRETMLAKNHDYGEAWRRMRISSMTDLILTKLQRIKQIEDNNGLTQVSEGVAANYIDMFNYAVFCLILMEEGA